MLRPAAGGDDVGAVLRQAQRQGAADTGSSADHHRDAICQIQ